jgi:hypothetical protein
MTIDASMILEEEYRELERKVFSFLEMYKALHKYMAKLVRDEYKRLDYGFFTTHALPLEADLRFVKNSLNFIQKENVVSGTIKSINEILNNKYVKFSFDIRRNRRKVCEFLKSEFNMKDYYKNRTYYDQDQHLAMSREYFDKLYVCLKLEGKI